MTLACLERDVDETPKQTFPGTHDAAPATAADELRAQIGVLRERKIRGEVSERAFRRQARALCVKLARVEAKAVMDPGEDILAEHHVIHSHFKLTESLLREPEQSAISWFATDRGVVRVRSSMPLGRTEGDAGLRLSVDGIAYDQVKHVTRKAEWRWGEVLSGLILMLLGLLLRRSLAIMAPALAALGALALLHGLVLPTRWIEVTDAGSVEPALTIYGLWRGSARRLLATVRAGLRKQAYPG